MPRLKEELQKSIRRIDNFDKFKDLIAMMVTAAGLRIELLESEAGTFFDGGSSTPSATGKQLLVALAHEMGPLANKISIEGTPIPDPRRETASTAVGSSRSIAPTPLAA